MAVKNGCKKTNVLQKGKCIAKRQMYCKNKLQKGKCIAKMSYKKANISFYREDHAQMCENPSRCACQI